MLKPYYEKDGIVIYLGDCLEVMPELDQVFDMILADWPYGTTACSWDSIIDLDKLWPLCKSLIKKNGAVVLMGSQPFTTLLVNAGGLNWFKYCWIWDKVVGSNFINAKKMPLKVYEDICIFGQGQITYNPQMIKRDKTNVRKNKPSKNNIANFISVSVNTLDKDMFPVNKIVINRLSDELNSNKVLHPTQKPVALFSYLIRTYTNKGESILDNTMGSGTTLVSAKKEKRQAVGIEISEEYCEIAAHRLDDRMEEFKAKQNKTSFNMSLF